MIDVKSPKKDLLALPNAKWNDIEWWDSLLIVPTENEHDSGYAHIAIIGCRYFGNEEKAVKILAYPDDVTWPINDGEWENKVRTDAFLENGVLHLWSNYNDFSIDSMTSSLVIKMRSVLSRERTSEQV